MATTSCSSLKAESKLAVIALEEDGELQFRLFYVIPFIGMGMWSPKSLRNHCSHIHEATVKYPTILARKLKRDVSRNGIDVEESAFAPRDRLIKRSRGRAALQETKE